MDLQTVLITNLIVVAGLMVAVWLVSLLLRDVSIVDLVWGLGFVVIAWVTFSRTAEVTPRNVLLTVLTTIWGLRLTAYLAWRNIGKPEDYRYRDVRERWGRWFPLLSLGLVFALQGVVMWVVSLPIQTGQASGFAVEIGWLGVLGALVWLTGLLFEGLGDYQLAKFKADASNAVRVLDRGLWRYTRHPNYFGDFLVWWGLYLVSFGQGEYWWSFVGPLVMSIFLMRVSGVTLLEKSLRERKAEYADYIARTSAFFPLPPKEAA